MPTTIYIFGNLQVFQAALTGLQMIFNPANNTDWAVGGSLFGVGPVVTIGLLISLLHLTTKGIWTQKMSLHHVGILLGLYAALFVPQTSVTVQDIYTGQTVVVDGIPIGVAYPAAIVSQLSYDAATQLGQAFQSTTATSPPTDISNGFGEPLQQMLSLRRLYQQFVKNDTPLAQAYFVLWQQCAYPIIASNTYFYQEYETAPDLMAFLSTLTYVNAQNQPMLAMVPGGSNNPICSNPQGCSMTCGSLLQAVQNNFQTWMTGTGPNSCAQAVSTISASSSQTSKPATDCSGNSFGNIMASLGTTGSNFISQMVNACMASAGMSAGSSLFAAQNDQSVMQSYCMIDSNTMSQAQVENAGSASMFLKNMLPLMSVLQFLFIALAPLAAFTLVMAGSQGIGMFVKYIMFGLWTQSWLPVAALLNDYSQITLQHSLAALGQATTGVAANVNAAVVSTNLASLTPPTNALTLQTLPMIIEGTMQALSNANMLMALTPIITMIVFTGSYMGMAQLAQDIGGEDKVGKNAELETPSVAKEQQAFGVSTPGLADGGYVVNTAVGKGMTADVGSAMNYLNAQANNLTGSSSNSYGTTIAQQSSRAINYLQGHEQSIASQYQSTDTATREAATAYKATEDWAKKHGLNNDQALSFAVAYAGALKAGASQEAAIKAGEAAAGGFNGADKADVKSAIQDSESLGQMKGLTTSHLAKLVQSVAHSSTDQETKKTGESIANGLSDTETTNSSYQASLQRAAAIKQEAQQLSNLGASATVDTARLSAYATEKGRGNTSQALGVISGMAEQAGVSQQFAQEMAAIQKDVPGTDPLDAATTAYMRVAQKSPEATAVAAERLYGIDTGAQALSATQATQRDVKQNMDGNQAMVEQGAMAMQPAAAAAQQGANAAQANEGKVNKKPDGYNRTTRDIEGQAAQWQSAVQEMGKGQIQLSKEAQDLEKQISNNAGMRLANTMKENPTASLAGLAILNAIGPLSGVIGGLVGAGAASLTKAFGSSLAAEAIAGSAADVGTAAAAAAGSIGIAALGVGAAGAAGYAVGTLANEGIDALIRQATNGKEQTLGGAIYDWIHGGENQNEKAARAKTVASTLNAASELQKTNPEYQKMTAELQQLASQGKTAANDPEAARLTRESLEMIRQQAGKMGE